MMHIEFEVRFIVDFDCMRKQIQLLGGKCTRKRTFMKQYMLDLRDSDGYKWIRVRDEGEYITLAMKIHDETRAPNIDTAQEIEVRVSNFDDIIQMLEIIGFVKSLYMESYREIWSIENCLIMFDEKPGLDPYIEVEGCSKEDVYAVVKMLGLDIDQGIYEGMYKYKHGLSREGVKKFKEITFSHHP